MTTPSPFAGVLRELHGTTPFLEYCRLRGVLFAQEPGTPMPPGGLDRWSAALAVLSDSHRAEVETDLRWVGQMQDVAEGLLRRAVSDGPGDDVPAGAPAALWYLIHHSDAFRETYRALGAEGTGRWRVARLAAVPEDADPTWRAEALRAAICESSRCYGLPKRGEYVLQAVGPGWLTASAPGRWQPRIAFAHPAGSRVALLQTELPPDREQELLHDLCAAVLKAAPLVGAPAHDLAPLKATFRPLPDAPDTESVQLRALHLRYPGRLARRRLALQTLPSDAPLALEQMLREHVPDRGLLDSMEVAFAELHVRLIAAGGARTHVVRLWPDHANLGPDPLGDRLRRCLARWGLCHAR